MTTYVHDCMTASSVGVCIGLVIGYALAKLENTFHRGRHR